MSNTPCYIIARFIVYDKETYRRYEKGFFPILKRYQGEFITYDDNPETLEGGSPRQGRIVMFSFPSEQLAKDWYNDPEYQSLSEHRRNGTSLEFITLVHGLPPR